MRYLARHLVECVYWSSCYAIALLKEKCFTCSRTYGYAIAYLLFNVQSHSYVVGVTCYARTYTSFWHVLDPLCTASEQKVTYCGHVGLFFIF